MMSDFQTDLPKPDESQSTYAKRLESEGQRELYIRKALRAHFDLGIEDTIAACAKLPAARQRELQDLRKRFPDLNQNRFAHRIGKTLTIPKQDAQTWASRILSAEGPAAGQDQK
jgi:hypothetical protein